MLSEAKGQLYHIYTLISIRFLIGVSTKIFMYFYVSILATCFIYVNVLVI
jgi:hypothetical protein